MSYIKKWSYIHKTYNECSRSSILRGFYSFSKIRKNYHYWLILCLYLGVSICSAVLVFNYKNLFFVHVLLVICAAVFSRYLIENLLSKDLKKYYDENGINEFPLLKKDRYLSYALFKEKLEKDNIITTNDIDSIIKWNEIGSEKIDRMVFFKSKWFILIASGTFGFIGQYFFGLKLSIKEVLLIAYIALIALWLAFVIFDFSAIAKEQKLNIYRFLKWFQIDSKKT